MAAEGIRNLATPPAPPAALIAAAKHIAAQRLPSACDHDGAYAMGFLAVHPLRKRSKYFRNVEAWHLPAGAPSEHSERDSCPTAREA